MNDEPRREPQPGIGDPGPASAPAPASGWSRPPASGSSGGTSGPGGFPAPAPEPQRAATTVAGWIALAGVVLVLLIGLGRSFIPVVPGIVEAVGPSGIAALHTVIAVVIAAIGLAAAIIGFIGFGRSRVSGRPDHLALGAGAVGAFVAVEAVLGTLISLIVAVVAGL
ncbi:MAG: hypothetical protein GXX90_09820 [Microbacteriaceae bacterium]|nr:hypothetical protein [Microbacteriaceae bacterium]